MKICCLTFFAAFLFLLLSELSASSIPDPDIFDGAFHTPDPQNTSAMNEALKEVDKQSQSSAEQAQSRSSKNSNQQNAKNSKAASENAANSNAEKANESSGAASAPGENSKVAKEESGEEAEGNNTQEMASSNGQPGSNNSANSSGGPPGEQGANDKKGQQQPKVTVVGQIPDNQGEQHNKGQNMPSTSGGKSMEGDAPAQTGDIMVVGPSSEEREQGAPKRDITLGDVSEIIVMTIPDGVVGGPRNEQEEENKQIGADPEIDKNAKGKKAIILFPSNKGKSRGVEQGETVPTDL